MVRQVVFSPDSLGHFVKRIRQMKRLNQTQAGELYRLQQSTISSIENGAPGTRLDTVFRVLAALDIELIAQQKNPERDEDE